MYVYDQYDQKIVDERVAQYRGQTERFLAGKSTTRVTHISAPARMCS
jgi:hypothetical protein